MFIILLSSWHLTQVFFPRIVHFFRFEQVLTSNANKLWSKLKTYSLMDRRGNLLNIHPTSPPPFFLSIRNNAIFEDFSKLDLPCSWFISYIQFFFINFCFSCFSIKNLFKIFITSDIHQVSYFGGKKFMFPTSYFLQWIWNSNNTLVQH